MGYHIHHTIVCSAWKEEHIIKAHTRAVEIFGSLVSEITPKAINNYRAFFVAPDGSKESWPDSTDGDNKRDDFKAWLKKANLFVDWVEVSFGGDEPDDNTEILESGNYVERDEALAEIGRN